MNLRTVDLNLLVVLQKLLVEWHVLRAAEQLGMSQPAVSRALQRLREMLGDPLLVRTSHGYDLSARANENRVGSRKCGGRSCNKALIAYASTDG